MDDPERLNDSSNDSVGGLATRDFSRRQVLGGLGAGAAMAAFPILGVGRPNVAYAQPEVTTSFTFTDTANTLWGQIFQQTYGGIGPDDGPREIREILSLAYINALHRTYASRGERLSPSQRLAYYKQFQRYYDQVYAAGVTPETQAARADLEGTLVGVKVVSAVLALIPDPRAQLAGGGVALLGVLYENLWYGPESKRLSIAEELVAGQRLYNGAESAFLGKSWVIADAMNLATEYQDAARGYNAIYYPVLRQKISVVDNPEGVIVYIDDPQRNIPPNVRTTIKGAVNDAKVSQDGETLEMSEETLERIRAAFHDELLNTNQDLLDAELKFLRGMEELQKDFSEWQDDPETQQRKQEERQAAEETYQLAMQGAQNAVFLLSTFAAFADKKLANEISVFGSASIQIVDSIKKFTDGTVKLGNLASAVTSAALAGNIAGAVLSIVSLFQDEQKPEEVILEQIGILREQVDTLYQDMHERFDRIEVGMNQIYNTMQARFGQIDIQLGRITGSLEDVQKDLAFIESKLASLGRNMQETVAATKMSEIVLAINGGLDYKKTTGENMPYLTEEGASPEGTWVYYANRFYSWAHFDAKDELWQDVSERSYEDKALLDELSRPLENNVSYLAGLLKDRKDQKDWTVGPFATTDKLPNPVIWNLSFRAFIELRREWPEHAKRYYPARLKEIKADGTRLREALRGITVKADTSEGPVPNHELFDALIVNNREFSLEKTTEPPALGLLGEQIRAVEKDLLKPIQQGKSQKLDIDFWAGPTQSIKYMPELSPNPPDTQPPSTIGTLVSSIPDPYLLAEYMSNDPTKLLTLGYRSGWTDIVGVNTPREGVYAHGIPRIDLTVNYAGAPVLRRYVTGSTRVEMGMLIQQVPDWSWHQDPTNGVLVHHWTEGQNLRSQFDNGASKELSLSDEEKSYYTQQRGEVANQVGSDLRKLQMESCSAIIPALQLTGGSDDLRNAVQSFDGAKKLLNDVVRLGMPDALEGNDFLRSLLYGSQSLVDAAQIKEGYAAAQSNTPVNWYVSLQSFNYPERLVRHQDGLGELMEVPSESDKLDATFKIVPGLADSEAISLESVNSPGHYLRQQFDRVKLHPFSNDSLFKADATFKIVPGLADARGASFSSYYHPDRYLRHRDFHIWEESGSGTLFRQDATFQMLIKNPQEFFTRVTDQRAMALHKLFTGYLDKIGNGEHAEHQAMINTTLLRSDIIDTIVQNTDTGTTLVEVPDVVRLPLDEAQARLEVASLKLGSQEEASSNEVKKGLVIEQKPAAGSEARLASAVDVTVSTGSGNCLTALATPIVVTTAMLVARKVLLKRLG